MFLFLFIIMNAFQKKFLQIYELFAKDRSVSKKFPAPASPRLYLVIFFPIYGLICPVLLLLDNSKVPRHPSFLLNIKIATLFLTLSLYLAGEEGMRTLSSIKHARGDGDYKKVCE